MGTIRRGSEEGARRALGDWSCRPSEMRMATSPKENRKEKRRDNWEGVPVGRSERAKRKRSEWKRRRRRGGRRFLTLHINHGLNNQGLLGFVSRIQTLELAVNGGEVMDRAESFGGVWVHVLDRAEVIDEEGELAVPLCVLCQHVELGLTEIDTCQPLEIAWWPEHLAGHLVGSVDGDGARLEPRRAAFFVTQRPLKQQLVQDLLRVSQTTVPGAEGDCPWRIITWAGEEKRKSERVEMGGKIRKKTKKRLLITFRGSDRRSCVGAFLLLFVLSQGWK